MQVPDEVEARDLDVSLQPFNIRVAHKHTNEVRTSWTLQGQTLLYKQIMQSEGEGWLHTACRCIWKVSLSGALFP